MRRTNKRNHNQGRDRETPERMLDRVLGAFHRWLGEREADPQRLNDVTDAVRTACELKGSVLGEPNPADWDPDVSVEVLSEVFPSKVLGVDETYIAAIVPGMLTFIDFLTETGRWKPHNDAAATRKSLKALGPQLPQRFKEPMRLSMGGRIVQLAIDEGVDVSDPQALGGFMQRFNEMPFEWRKRLTDAPETVDAEGRTPDSRRREGLYESPFDSPGVREEVNEAILAAATAVGFTGEPVVITVPDAESELARLMATPLLTRMIALAEWVRPGKKVTATGALRRDDTAEWLERFGSHVGGFAPNSMWDCPELAIPWSVAAHLGLIDIATTKAYPGPDNDIFIAGDAPSQIRCAREAVNLLLRNLIGSGDELTDLDRMVTGLLLPVLACLCGPKGADLTPLRTLADQLLRTPPASASHTLSGIVFRMVLNIVDMLQEWGVVSMSASKASIPSGLRPAVVGAIYAPGAPFTLRLKPGAVPLDV